MGQNLQPITGNDDVSKWVKNSWVGRKLQKKNKRTINARQLTSALDLLLWKIGGHADLSSLLGSPNPIDNPIASRRAILSMVTAIFFFFESVCQYATKEQKQDTQG